MTAPAREDLAPHAVTRLLRDARSGDQAAIERLFQVVYQDLRRLARGQLRRGGSGATLSSTELVHEAYLRLARPGNLDVADRTHFFAVAARAMRQILVDHARRRVADKRGGGTYLLALDDAQLAGSGHKAEMLVALDDALGKLAQVDARLARMVELRFFGGLTLDEMAAGVGLTERTLKRDWRRAKAYLYRELSTGASSP